MQNLFVYRGEDPGLLVEMEQYGKIINRAYNEFFTPEQRSKILDSNERTLRPSSFFHTREDLKRDLGYTVPEQTPDKYGVASLTDPDSDQELYAPFFYASTNNFPFGGSAQFTNKKIASYVHEFDHYVLQALQRAPINSIHNQIHAYLKPQCRPFKLDAYLRELGDLPLSPEEKLSRAMLAQYDPLITESFEKATRILDNVILRSIGVNAPLRFRGKPKVYGAIQALGKTIVLPINEFDPFLGKNNKEAIDQVINWERYYQFPKVIGIPMAFELLQKAKERVYKRMSLEALMDKKCALNALQLTEEDGSGI